MTYGQSLLLLVLSSLPNHDGARLKMITEERLKEIEARAKAAEAGPWDIDLLDDRVEAVGRKATDHGGENAWVLLSDGSPYTLDRADAEFIAHARQDVPDLVAEVRRLRAALIERVYDKHGCEGCGRDRDETHGSAAGGGPCPVSVLLGGSDG